MARVILRQAGEGDDFAAILKLVQDCFAYMEARIDPPSSMHRMTVDSVAAHARDEEIWLCEDEAGALLGCVFFTRKPPEAGQSARLYLGKMAVGPAARGQGLSRLMVEKAAERAVAQGLPLLELEARIELVENHNLFAGLGFVKTAENAYAGYDRPTSIVMQRPAMAG